MFEKRKPTQIVGDSWAVYSYEYGKGQRAIISFDVACAQEEQHQGYRQSERVIVYIPTNGRILENGLPAREELPKLSQFEDDLLKRLQQQAVDCKFVGKMTYAGMREFVFQVEDVATFHSSVAKMMRDTKDYKIVLRQSEGWHFFDEKIRPTPIYWQQINDQCVIRELIKAGSDPQATHMIEHFITGEPQKLQRLRDELTAHGFSEINRQAECLTLGKPSKLDLDAIFSVTGKLSSYCNSIGVQYDGWGCAVVK